MTFTQVNMYLDDGETDRQGRKINRHASMEDYERHVAQKAQERDRG